MLYMGGMGTAKKFNRSQFKQICFFRPRLTCFLLMSDMPVIPSYQQFIIIRLEQAELKNLDFSTYYWPSIWISFLFARRVLVCKQDICKIVKTFVSEILSILHVIAYLFAPDTFSSPRIFNTTNTHNKSISENIN